MRICTISDTHRKHKKIKIPDNLDLILHAGDISGRGHESEIVDFLKWYGSLDVTHKVMIAGNHDFGFETEPEKYAKMAAKYGIILLNDTSVTIEGLKIWGSPVQPEFCNWAFNRSRTIEDSMTEKAQKLGHAYIGNHWDLIPDDADIVITHGPVYKILDETYYGNESVGCEVLARKLAKIKPILHVSGHIHEARGVRTVLHDEKPTTYVNASSLDLSYEPWNDSSFVFELDRLKVGVSCGRD